MLHLACHCIIYLNGAIKISRTCKCNLTQRISWQMITIAPLYIKLGPFTIFGSMHTIPHLFVHPVITLDVIILLAACVLHAMICILVGMAWCQVPASLWACAVFYGFITCTFLVPIMHCDNLLSWIACNTAPLQATLILYIVPTMTLPVILLFCMKHPNVHWSVHSLFCYLILGSPVCRPLSLVDLLGLFALCSGLCIVLQHCF